MALVFGKHVAANPEAPDAAQAHAVAAEARDLATLDEGAVLGGAVVRLVHQDAVHAVAEMLPVEAEAVDARADGECEIEQAGGGGVDELERGSTVPLPGIGRRAGDAGVGMHLQPSDAIGPWRNLDCRLALRSEIKELLEDSGVVGLAVAHGPGGFNIDNAFHNSGLSRERAFLNLR